MLDVDDLSNAETLVRAIDRELDGLVLTEGGGDHFAFYDPDGVTRPDARFPFCTIVTGDREYDAASDLDRELGTFRINLGIGRATYESHFGSAPRQPAGIDVIDTGFDYAARDALMPHPLYAPMHWVCVVNPGEKTLGDLNACLVEAHGVAQRMYDNQQKRRSSSSG